MASESVVEGAQKGLWTATRWNDQPAFVAGWGRWQATVLPSTGRLMQLTDVVSGSQILSVNRKPESERKWYETQGGHMVWAAPQSRWP
jgi:hypothetical protein